MARNKEYTLIDQIGTLLVKASAVVLLVLLFNTMSFNITVSKKPNNFIATAGEAVDSGYNIYKTVKNFVK
jgi:hypothetical protein